MATTPGHNSPPRTEASPEPGGIYTSAGIKLPVHEELEIQVKELTERFDEIVKALRMRARDSRKLKEIAIENEDTFSAAKHMGREQAFVQCLILLTGDWSYAGGVE